MYNFIVKFCKGSYRQTCNANDIVSVEVNSSSFDMARRKARKKATEMGYSGKDGWKWYSTTINE